jgi:hypothetical protein
MDKTTGRTDGILGAKPRSGAGGHPAGNVGHSQVQGEAPDRMQNVGAD